MTSIIDRGLKHFAKRREIEIPEWPDDQGKPTVLYWNALSLKDQQRLRNIRDVVREDASRSALRIIVDRAEDAEGNKVFCYEDIDKLNEQVDAVIISRILEAMTSTITVEDAEKN